MKDPDGETPDESIKKENLGNKVTEIEARTAHSIMAKKGLDIVKSLQKEYGISNTKELTKQQYADLLMRIKQMPDMK